MKGWSDELDWNLVGPITAQKMNFSNKYFLSKCDQIRCFLQIWSNLLKKSLMENIFWAVIVVSQPVFSCSKLTIETPEQGVKYVQS